MKTTEHQVKHLKIYQIPCVWQNHGYYEIEAVSLGDAIALAYERGELPLFEEYIEDSFEIDYEGVELAYANELCLMRGSKDAG